MSIDTRRLHRIASLTRVLAQVKDEVAIGTVTAQECADWIGYVLLRDASITEVADQLCDEALADSAATFTGREYLDIERDANAGDDLEARCDRWDQLAQELDLLYDEPLAQQGTWL